MTKLRRDFLTGEWVTISEQRDLRPMDFEKNFRCPFCPENYDLLKEPVYKHERVCVVANIYPAFDTSEGGGYGIHEVLIDTPSHTEKLHEFSIDGILEVFYAIQARLRFFKQDKRIKYIQVFKNHGRGAGASISHSHWQIVAMDFVPQKQEEIIKNFSQYYSDTGNCYLCDVLEEIKEKRLDIWQDERAIAYAPYASPYKFGLRIMTKRHFTDFLSIDNLTLGSMAAALKNALIALNGVHNGLAYNICFQDAALDRQIGHFFIQLIPRLGNMAGFEFGTGCYINSLTPEKSAGILKEILR